MMNHEQTKTQVNPNSSSAMLSQTQVQFCDDEEESEVWKVVCQTGSYDEDGTLEGLYPKNHYTFDNFKDAKNEFDSIVKAEEADERYAEIALWTSKNEDEELEVWYYEKDDA